MQSIPRDTRLDASQAGIRIVGRNHNLRYAEDNTVRAENEEELKNLLMRVKEDSQEHGSKLNIKKKKKKQNRTKTMASDTMISWKTEQEKRGAVTDFNFLGSKIPADGD